MKKIKLLLLLVAITPVFLFSGCGSSKSIPALSPESSFMKALTSNSNLSSLTSLLSTADIGKLLGKNIKGPFTLLAPNNTAFEGAGDLLANLKKPENIGQLATLLKNHLVKGKLDPAALMKGGVSTASGNPLNLAGANLGSLIGSDQANIIPIDKILK